MVKSLRILRSVACPESVNPVELSECRRCRWHRKMVGYHALDQKVTCGRSVEGTTVEFAVFCPMGEKMVQFRKCLNCGYMKWFYGFHNENPVVYCDYG